MRDVYVLGAGLPALAAALELAEVGLSVRIGADAAAAAQPPQTPAETHADRLGVRDPGGMIRGFLRHLAAPIVAGGHGDDRARPVETRPEPALVRGRDGRPRLLPEPSVLGIPAVPMAREVVEIIGGGPATRAALDRIRPVLTIGKTHELGTLVRARMGRAVLDRLVEPLVRERFGVDADEVDVALAAPGLNEALTRAGSLSGAVLMREDRTAERETLVAPAGGWAALHRAVLERLSLYNVEFASEPVVAVRRVEPSSAASADSEPASADSPAEDPDVASDAVFMEEGGWLIEEAGGEMPTRSLVLGGPDESGETSAGDPLEEVRAAMGVDRFRVTGLIEVERPGVHLEPGEALVETVDAEAGSPWSVRLVHDAGHDDDGRWFAKLSGPSTPPVSAGYESWNASLAVEDREVVLRRVLDAAGLEPAATALGFVAAVEGVAPYVSIERRDADRAALREWCSEHPSILISDEGCFGGDQAAALASAQRDAVALRRRLAGIAD